MKQIHCCNFNIITLDVKGMLLKQVPDSFLQNLQMTKAYFLLLLLKPQIIPQWQNLFSQGTDVNKELVDFVVHLPAEWWEL